MKIIHGGDYNPDQWLDRPDILKEDIRLMKLAGCNAMSLGIFAWSTLESREGEYHFEWLDGIIDSLYDEGISTILATPSGARPPWLANKYPEVLRVTAEGQRRHFGERHNHCPSSPVYREKVAAINGRLAERYGKHPAVILWHLSNEYSGACYCPLCIKEFRTWVKNRYGDLKTLNHAWWTSFWSHGYSDWDEIEPPSPLGEPMLHGLNLDWKRFTTQRTLDFMKFEIKTVREKAPHIPVTTNLMGTFEGLDYWELSEPLDLVSWDSYPSWHGIGPVSCSWCDWDIDGKDWRLASHVAFTHDLIRSLKKRSFLLMESTPSVTNWQPVGKLKRPGMHALASIQAIAHGSDSVQYFQWRKSRGGFEKFHGAVVDHVGHENTRVFQEVRALGAQLAELDGVVGALVKSDVALYFDWENRWALDDAKGPRNDNHKEYREDCFAHYYQFWRRGIPMDLVDRRADLSSYKILIAPMLYMVRGETAKKIEEFVSKGGTFITTYWTGIVDENDLCHLGGFPGPLKKVLGVWAEEIDALYPGETRTFTMKGGNSLGLRGIFKARLLWEGLHVEGAEELATFDSDIFAGMSAVTMNRYGAGKAYYLASRNEELFLDEFYEKIILDRCPIQAWPEPLPEGLSVTQRIHGETVYRFVMNFTDRSIKLKIPAEYVSNKLLLGDRTEDSIHLKAWGFAVLRDGPG